nr:MAG TPA: hypothetical protein [Caudoviricetes sp.]
MAIRDDFFTALNKGAKWDVGVSINRTNPLPLDVNSVFDTKANLNAYVAGAFAYPGQIVALVEENATTIYYIDQAKTLQEVGKLPVGDGKSVTVAEDGTISLLGFVGADTGAQPVKQADGTIKWEKPNTTTVDGLSAAVESLDNRADALEGKVGDDSKGLVKEVADLTTEVSGVKSDLTGNYYNKEAVDGLVSGAFHFRGNAKELNAEGNLVGTDDKVITGKAGDVYQIGDKEYAYNGSAWVELGFTLDLSAYATTASVTTAKEEAITTAGTNADAKIATAKTELEGYVDGKITDLGIGDYAKSADVTSAISDAKTELKTYADTAKTEAITTAGTNADTKIATKIGDIGEGTVKDYVDGKETSLTGKITAVDDKVGALGKLSAKDEVAETDLAKALADKINAKADASSVYTQTEINTKVSGLETSIGANTDAITAINDDTNGILAKAKEYADGKVYDDTKVKADIATNATNITTNAGGIAENKTAIAAINNETTGILAQAKKYADDQDAVVKADVDKNTAAITKLNGTGEGSVSKTVADGIAKVVASAPEDFDTLKEIADWIANDTTGAAKMANDIAAVVGTDKGTDGTPKSMRTVAEEVADAKVGAIPNASQTVVGLIKGTDGKVNVAEGQITSITTDALTQGADVLILDGGTATA